MLTIRPSFRRLIWPPLMGKYLCMERFREMGQQLFVRLDQSKKFIVTKEYRRKEEQILERLRDDTIFTV